MNNKPLSDSHEYQICKDQCSVLKDKIEEKKDSVDKVLKFESLKQRDPLQSIQLDLLKLFKGHFGKIYSAQWNSTSKMICSAAQDGRVFIWDVINVKKVVAINLKSSWVMSCSFSPSSKYVASGGLDNLCTVYDIEKKNQDSVPLCELEEHEGYVSCTRFYGDDRILTSSGDTTCILWNIEKKTPERVFSEHSGDVMNLAINKQNQTFISGSCDSTIKLWDLRTGKCQGTSRGHEADVNSVDWYPDHYGYASGSDDSTCRLFDVRTYKELKRYESMNITCGVTSVSFSNSGHLLFAGYDSDPWCLGWDVAHGKQVVQLSHEFKVSSVSAAPEGTDVCTASWDTLLKIWGKKTI